MPLELKELMAEEPRLTLSVAESMTCGWLQSRIGSISGASEFFLGGITAYSIDQKVRHLGVDRDHAVAVNAVSIAVAEQMALGACSMFGSHLGLSTTGYAERDPKLGAPAPFAFWALVCRLPDALPQVRSGRIECAGASRVEAQRRVTDGVLGELVRFLVRLRSQR